jgi:hypothetical protein
MWRDLEMWCPLQCIVVAARHMKNHAILAACGAKNHECKQHLSGKTQDYVYNTKWT